MIRVDSGAELAFGGGSGFTFDSVVNSAIAGAGSLTVQIESVLRIAGACSVGACNVIDGNLSVTAGAGNVLITKSLQVTGTGKLDLADNAMVIDYDAPNSPLTTVQSYLGTGYANGARNGVGINSSVAAGNSTHALGYAEASSLTTIPSIFGPVDSTAVLVRYTRYGDADLSGNVNSDDFNRLAGSFGQSNTVWSQGNFNFDNATNSDDFNALATNFGLAVGAEAAARRAGGTPRGAMSPFATTRLIEQLFGEENEAALIV